MALEEAGLKLIADGLSAYLSDVGKADKANDGFYKSLDSAPKHANGFQQVITGMLRETGAALVQFGIQGAKAIGGFVKESIGLAGDFEAGMLEFQSVAGKDLDTSGLEEFHDLFLQLGKDLPVSTSEVQQAAVELVKGGIEPATIAAGGLESSIKFAAAAMKGDLIGAAEISAKIVGGWADVNATAAEKADLLAHSQNVLTKTSNAATVGVEDLALGLFNVQGNAKLAGIGFDDLTTTLALIAPNFSSASTAGTSLNAMIARLQPTTDPATQEMMKLGLYTEDAGSAFYDAQGNFIGWAAASQLLQDATRGLTDAQKQSTFQTIFGMDAQGAAAELTRQGAAGWDLMADKIDRANGVAENAAIKQQGFNTSLKNTMGSVETLQIVIGTALLPVLDELLNTYILPGVNALIDMSEALLGDDEAFSRLSPTMQAIVGVIDILIADTQDLVGWFGSIETQSSDLGTAITDLSGIWTKALDVVTNVGDGYLSIAQAVLPIVTGFVDEHGTEIAAFFQGAYTKIMSIVNTALDLYNAVVPAALGSAAQWIEDHAVGIQAVLSGAWSAITAIIDGALTLIEGTLKIALDIINGDWSKAWADLQAMSVRITLDIGQVISGFFDIIAGLFNTNMAAIGQTWADNWAMLVDIATQTDWAAVGESVVSGILQGLRDNWNSLTSWVSDKIGDLVNNALEAIGAGSPAVQWMPVGEFSVLGIMQGFSDTWPQLTALVGDLSDDLIDQVSELGQQVQGVIADSFGATASIDRQIASNIGKLEDVLSDYQQYTAGALKVVEKEARAFLDPAEGAKYFKMRSAQIFEYAKLQKELSEAQGADDKARIQAQMALIAQAHRAEISQFDANRAAQGNPYQGIIDQIQQLMAGGMPVNDTGPGHDLMLLLNRLLGIPGYAGGGSVAPNQPYWVGENGPELFISKLAGQIVPQSQPMQASALSGGNYSTTNSQSTTLNMPIYTNQSPSVMRDSMAIASAALL